MGVKCLFQVITDSSSSCASVRTYLSVGLFFFVSVASHLRVFAVLFIQLPSAAVLAASSAELCRADNLRPASNKKSPDRVVTSYRPGGGRRGDDMRPPPPMAVRLAADLRPFSDGSAVRTSLVAGHGMDWGGLGWTCPPHFC